MLIRIVRRYLRPYLGSVVLLLMLQVAATVGALYLPALNATIVDDGVTQGDTGHVLRVGGWMLLVSAAQLVCAVGAVRLAARAATGLGHDLRRDLFDAVQVFSARELGRFGAPSLITRSANDVQQVQMVVLTTFTFMVMAPIMLIGGVIMALRENPGLSALLLVIVPVLGTAVGLILWRMIPYVRAMQHRLDGINKVLREQITSLRVVRAFVQERRELHRFEEANEALYATSLGAGKLQALSFPTVMLVLSLSQVTLLWFGGHTVDAGDMQVGSLIAFLNYLMFILIAVTLATMMFMMIPRAAVAAGRIDEVLSTETSVTEPAVPVPLTDLAEGAGPAGRLVFESATFRQPGAEDPVLNDIDLTAEPGTVTAIVGSTGAGKSTLLGLVARLFDVTGGRILLDGVDLRRLRGADLHSLLGFVPQTAFLFSGTIASNLRYGNPGASEEEMWHALEVAQAADFVRALPEGLDAPVTPGGSTFSGGQRQRLAIARAIVRRPLVYLFDDSFSALDYATDARLRAALRPMTAQATVLVVAQRISTIRDADQILVPDRGRIAGRGTHRELLAENLVYQEIVSSQMSLEEAL